MAQQELINIKNSFSEVRINLLLKIYDINVNEKRFAYTEDLVSELTREKVSHLVGDMPEVIYIMNSSTYKALKGRNSFQKSNPGLVELGLKTDQKPRAGKIVYYAVKPAYYPQIEEMKKSRTGI
jgi:hypothetical protein